MSIKTLEILEQIKTLSALETAQLVEQIETTFDINASPSPIFPNFTVPLIINDEIEAPTEFDVVVDSVPADKKISVLKTVRVITDLGLKEAKEFVDTLPKTIKSGITKTEATEIRKQLEEAGASISIINS
ncbi:50S ribosomal protein L7/L12 [Calothrix sp. NIES-4071]|nr:50S ribosomal protein L7/L12 [Calothrix sp. NIES-4071]BAZ61164.1 50S ribosomal protein L7/L12 [Calothrix sp. NIES-4105]